MNPIEIIGLGLAAVSTAGAGVWAIASAVIGQINKNMDSMNAGIMARLDEMERARRSAGDQWRSMFNDQRRQSREISVRMDHIEERIQAFEHTVIQCQSCHHIPSDLPE